MLKDMHAILMIGGVVMAQIRRGYITEPKKYVFSWPHGPNNECTCRAHYYGEYDSDEECQQAFAFSSETATCVYRGDGLGIDNCNHVVSIDGNTNNNICRQMCQFLVNGDVSFDRFKMKCDFEKYQIWNDRATPLGKCFSNYIYGHYESFYGSYKAIEGILYPAKCQELCQNDENCANWYWRATPDDNKDPRQQSLYRCHLKNHEMVSSALNTIVKLDIDPDPQSCDVYSANACLRGLQGWGNKCLKCPCESVCAYRHSGFISGPKFCGVDFDACNPPTQPESTDTTTTTETVTTTATETVTTTATETVTTTATETVTTTATETVTTTATETVTTTATETVTTTATETVTTTATETVTTTTTETVTTTVIMTTQPREEFTPTQPPVPTTTMPYSPPEQPDVECAVENLSVSITAGAVNSNIKEEVLNTVVSSEKNADQFITYLPIQNVLPILQDTEEPLQATITVSPSVFNLFDRQIGTEGLFTEIIVP